ncbi:2OG-Fe(II) oxygenase family protein [Salinarimonas chemoclinalis]|uniref:2OG-Fe(II) oxygenase family protein n=1 Tax=Salinarimonas chemoclinalis TaxID=3241599 RepID=UPI003557535E
MTSATSFAGPAPIVPRRARLEAGRITLETGEDLSEALADGCLRLRIPPEVDLGPGLALARNFWREPDGGPADAYRGFRRASDIYFDREHFQTEHLLLDRPQRLRHLPADVVGLCDALAAIGRDVLAAVLSRLDVPREVRDRAVVGCLHGRAVEWMAVSHYRPERRQLGCPPHKDTGYVTVLYFDQEGLEARRDGAWRRIDPEPGYFLVNFGGALELLTRRLERPVEALLHRVAERRPDPGAEDRFSFAAFVNPAASGMLCELDGRRIPQPVQSVEDFLRSFNEETWRDSYADFGIVDPHDARPDDGGVRR